MTPQHRQGRGCFLNVAVTVPWASTEGLWGTVGTRMQFLPSRDFHLIRKEWTGTGAVTASHACHRDPQGGTDLTGKEDVLSGTVALRTDPAVTHDMLSSHHTLHLSQGHMAGMGQGQEDASISGNVTCL